MVRRFLVVVAIAMLAGCDCDRAPLPVSRTFHIKFTNGSEKDVVAVGCEVNSSWFAASTSWTCYKAVPDDSARGFYRENIGSYPITQVVSIEEVEK